MPIIDVQRRLAPAGEIRPGRRVLTGGKRKDGKPASRPESLENWRFTSRNSRALDAIAGLYGGVVVKWEDAPTADQWELLSDAAEIDVVLPPESVAFSQWMELWSGGGCKRRCDGVTEQLSGDPCLCDEEKQECKPMTRLSVMLSRVPTTGLWRVTSTGHNAKAELAGAMELAELLTRATGMSMLPAELRLEHRKQIRDGQTKQFVVPTLDYQVDIAALAVAPGPGFTPVPVGELPEAPGSSTAEQIASVDQPRERPSRKNAAAPLPSTGLRPRRVFGGTDATSAGEARIPPGPGASPAAISDGREGDGDASRPGAAAIGEIAASAAPVSFDAGEIASEANLAELREWAARLDAPGVDRAASKLRTDAKLGSIHPQAPPSQRLLASQVQDFRRLLEQVQDEVQDPCWDKRRKTANALMGGVGIRSAEARHELMREATGGATESSAQLSGEQLDQIRKACAALAAADGEAGGE